METTLSVFAAALSLLSFGWSLWVHYRAQVRERRQDTLDAFNALQAQVLDELIQYKKNAIKEIAKHNTSEEYKKLSTLLARCNHFAVGVNLKIYDLETVRRLGGEHIVRIYKEFLPLIQTKRKYGHNLQRYQELEALALRLGYKCNH